MIPSELTGFLEQGLSIHIGVRDDELHPLGARAVAAAVDADGQHLTVYVAESAVARLLPHLQSNGQAAVGFGRPEDDRACQVKGVVVAIRSAEPREEAMVSRQWHGLMAQFEKIGIPGQVAAGWAWWPVVAIRLRVTAVFEQTPGPAAGVAIA